MFYRSSYTPGGPSYTFQGTRRELDKYLAKTGTKVVGGGYGSYIVARPAQGCIYEYENENSSKPIRKIQPNKCFIRERYDKKNVTGKDYDRLVAELNTGTLNIRELVY